MTHTSPEAGMGALKELLAKASPLPWSSRVGGEHADDVWVASDSQRPWEDHQALKLWSRTMGRGDYAIGSPEHKAAIANAELLCAAVNSLPAMIECVDALEEMTSAADLITKQAAAGRNDSRGALIARFDEAIRRAAKALASLSRATPINGSTGDGK